MTKHRRTARPKEMSALMAAFLTALVAMTTCVAFALASLALAPDATSFASAPVAQPVLQHTNTTGELDVLARHPAGIYFEPMADDQSVALSAVNDLLHREAICGDLGVSRNAAGLRTEAAVHANMLRPSAPGLGGYRHSDRPTNGMQCTPKSLPCMRYLKLLAEPFRSNPQHGLHDMGMRGSLAAGKKASLLVGSADLGSGLKESASLTAARCPAWTALLLLFKSLFKQASLLVGSADLCSRLKESASLVATRYPAWIGWQGLPLSQAARSSANTSRTSRKPHGAFNEQEARGGSCGGAQPSSTQASWLWQGVKTGISSAVTCVHCCLVLASLSLLWTRRRALPFGHKSCRFKLSCVSEVRASRPSPAGSLARGGRTGGVRRASLLLLGPWLAVCTAAGTVCSNEPTACDGTYSGTYLCALPTTLAPTLHSARLRG